MSLSPDFDPIVILIVVMFVGVIIVAFIKSRRAKSPNFDDKELTRAEFLAKTPEIKPRFVNLKGRRMLAPKFSTGEVVYDVAATTTDTPGHQSSDDLDRLAHPSDEANEP